MTAGSPAHHVRCWLGGEEAHLVGAVAQHRGGGTRPQPQGPLRTDDGGGAVDGALGATAGKEDGRGGEKEGGGRGGCTLMSVGT
jgi:hypothetical protein